jgi:hypothetical protein
MGRALKSHFGELAAAALDAIGGDPERMAAARERMGEWAETLREHGIGVSDSANPSPASEPVTAPGGAEETAPAGEPQKQARWVGETPTLSERLRELAEDFRRRADALAAAREAAVRSTAPADGLAGGSANGGSGPSRPAAAAGDAAELLESAAAGVENLGVEAAGRLRELAARLKAAGKPGGEPESSAKPGSGPA